MNWPRAKLFRLEHLATRARQFTGEQSRSTFDRHLRLGAVLEDPDMRPKPISPEQREEIIVHKAAGLVAAYRYFGEHRQVSAALWRRRRRTAPKVGRNDPSPCSSGQK